MRHWIDLLEDAEAERESLIADISYIVAEYVTAGEAASMRKFNEVYEKWTRPTEPMLLYRVLRLTSEQMVEFKANHSFPLRPMVFSSWTKSLESAHLLASTKGHDTIILQHMFPPQEIVIDVV